LLRGAATKKAVSATARYRFPEINLQLKIPQTPLEKGKTGEATATIYLDLYKSDVVLSHSM
jgi:hypothetical protein